MSEEQVESARRGPGRPRQEHVTRAVLDAVVALVAESGMAALTMDAVAARAGVSKPAMYRRWSTTASPARSCSCPATGTARSACSRRSVASCANCHSAATTTPARPTVSTR
ncbi:helix-turn-helix domain-containing protein [Streptomyces sp. NPDC051956]|uniref:helix-turn-helix domain-containing protein n=1 Tax=Streptomyces sp. NPDC051956 TaxID=3365677 RepID=UPI0037D5601E